jgi:hypothetical protein
MKLILSFMSAFLLYSFTHIVSSIHHTVTRSASYELERKTEESKETFERNIIFATIPVIYFGIQIGINESNSRFSQEKWQDYFHEHVDHMLAHYSLKEMSKEEVYQLLGEPTTPAYFMEPNNIVYYLGARKRLNEY